MDCSCIGVGSVIPMRPIAALVASFRSIPRKTPACAAGSSAAFRSAAAFVPAASVAGAAGVEFFPLRRISQHSEQYTGRSGLGRNGTVVRAPQSVQIASCSRVAGLSSRGAWRRGDLVPPLGFPPARLPRSARNDGLLVIGYAWGDSCCCDWLRFAGLDCGLLCSGLLCCARL